MTRQARPKTSTKKPDANAPYPYPKKVREAIEPRHNPLAEAKFTTAAHNNSQLPADQGAEVAFAGRSNAGKSSALNALSGRTHLARVSKTPGRTQQLVVFEVDATRRLIDLPGYGYAQVAQSLREHWRGVLDEYFTQRVSLRGLVLAMDVRHPMTEFDQNMLAFAASRVLPTHVLLTKADKLSRSQGLNVLRAVKAEIDTLGLPGSAQLMSSMTKDGVPEARKVVLEWLGFTGFNSDGQAPSTAAST